MNTRAPDVREMSIRDMLQILTGGRPYLFVIMSYKPERKELYECIYNIVEKKFNMACIRADQVASAGYDLLAKIHQLINRAELVIAEISEWSPNVFYEIGYAVGMQKPPLLLIEKGGEIPTDLKGLELMEYRNTIGGIGDFERDFSTNLRLRMNSELALLRDMLEAMEPQPSYIVTSPKYPGEHSRIRGQVYDCRTFGDHLGILGLISAFGSMWGERRGIELISAQHAPPDLLQQDMNLYLIGSRKVNHYAGEMLAELQQHKNLTWTFDPTSTDNSEEGDWTAALYRTEGETRKCVKGRIEQLGDNKEDVWTEDYGIIVRGPHPRHPQRLVLILAGAHSLGSGAACIAATRSSLIKEIRGKLPPGVLEDKRRSFWALVKGIASREDFLLDEEGVSIEEAGVYE